MKPGLRALPFIVFYRALLLSVSATHKDTLHSIENLIIGTEDFGATMDAVRSAGRPLIFDIGYNDGNDARFYTENGYTVIAVDANPTLIEAAKNHSADLLSEGKLVVLHAGIVDTSLSDPPLTFYKNTHFPIFSSFEKDKGCPPGTVDCEEIKVPMLRCDSLFVFGRPYYLKVDIEERHYSCIHALRDLPSHLLPLYASWEMHEMAQGKPYPIIDTSLVLFMYELGYTGIKIAEQTMGNVTAHLPKDASDIRGKGKEWKSVDYVLTKGLINPRITPRYIKSWFDFVMKLADELDTGQEEPEPVHHHHIDHTTVKQL